MTTENRTIATRHGRLAYSTRGSGPPLVLLPANGHDAHDFDAVRGALSRTFQTFAFDWPAMGASAPLANPERASAVLFGEMLEDAVDALSLAPAVFVGHSVGGFAAARLALGRPALVRALVLVDSGGFSPLGVTGALFCRLKGHALSTRLAESAFARSHTKRRNVHVHAMLARIDRARHRDDYAKTVAGVWRSFANPEHHLRAKAREIRCPTLLVWGALDPVLPAKRAGEAARLAIPGARLCILGTGHSPFVEDPEAFLAEVQPFLGAI